MRTVFESLTRVPSVGPGGDAPTDDLLVKLSGERLRREAKTMASMQRLYCRGVHGTRQSLCPECQSLLDYALLRLQRCRFGEEKPTCAKCPVHCYQPAWREAVKAVMRYAGPRMVWRHPILALRHLWDGYRGGARTRFTRSFM